MCITIYTEFVDDRFGFGLKTEFKYGCQFWEWAAYSSEAASQWLLVWLFVTRLASIWWPTRAEKFTSMRTTTIVIVVVLLYSTLSSTFTFLVYDVEIQEKNITHNISCFDATNSTFRTTKNKISSEYNTERMCNPRKAARENLTMLLLGGNKFIISTFVLLIVTIALGWALFKFGKTRERLTIRKNDGKEKALQNRKPSRINIKVKVNRETQMAVTLLFISGFHLIIHLIYMIDFVLLYSGIAIFNFPKSTIETLEVIEEVTDAFNILIRLWNFYAYLLTIPSFRFTILELITCGRWPKSREAIH